MKLELNKSVSTAVEPSVNVLRVATMFGLGVDERRDITVVPPTGVRLEAGQVVFVTGTSGSGKSTLLRLIAKAIQGNQNASVLRLDDLDALPDRPVVDCFEPLLSSLEEVLSILGLAGLSDAFVMLRKPDELSDGQRYRLKLAQVMATVGTSCESRLHVVLADEFCATLDRQTAMVIGRNIRKWADREDKAGRRVCFVAATTHDDLLESLEPDVLIVQHLGGGIEVHYGDRVCAKGFKQGKLED